MTFFPSPVLPVEMNSISICIKAAFPGFQPALTKPPNPSSLFHPLDENASLEARIGAVGTGSRVHLFMEWVQNPYDYSADGVKVSGFTIRLWGLRFIRVPRHVLKYADD